MGSDEEVVGASEVRKLEARIRSRPKRRMRRCFSIYGGSDNGSPYTAKETRVFAQALNLTPCFTPVASPESNGLSEGFVKTLKRDDVRLHPLPDAKENRAVIDRRMDRGLQREPSSFRAQNALAARVQKSPIMTPGCPDGQGQLQDHERWYLCDQSNTWSWVIPTFTRTPGPLWPDAVKGCGERHLDRWLCESCHQKCKRARRQHCKRERRFCM